MVNVFSKFTDLFGWTNSNVWIEIAKKTMESIFKVISLNQLPYVLSTIL